MQPGGHGILICRPADIQTVGFFESFFEFFLDLCLGLAQHIFDEPFASFGVVPGGVPTLSPTIFALTDVTLAVGPFLCHGRHLPSLVMPT